VALDRALEALALGDARDLHGLALLEHVDLDLLTHHELADLIPELGQAAQRRGVGLLEVAQLALGDLLLADVAERELHGLVAVTLLGADGGDPAGTGLHDRHALDVAVLGVEDLRHTELASQQCRHQINWI
jgi:hypothetical protein